MFREQILDKMQGLLRATPDHYEAGLLHWFDQAKRIFICGAGRSRLVGNFLAMRLMHGGYDVYVTGEIVTPSIQAGDVLLVISGSGETEQLIGYVTKARKLGAQCVLISSRHASTLANLVDEVFQIGEEGMYTSHQAMPMGTMFELSTLLFLEGVVAHLMQENAIDESSMRARHANLE